MQRLYLNQINLIWGSGKKEMSKKKGRGSEDKVACCFFSYYTEL